MNFHETDKKIINKLISTTYYTLFFYIIQIYSFFYILQFLNFFCV